MTRLIRSGGILVVALGLVMSAPGSCRSDGGRAVQKQIFVYTGANTQGYLQPMANAFGAALNSTYSYSAYIPPTGLHVSFEAVVMGVFFEDSDRTFTASTESGFVPETEERYAPTVVGPGGAVTVTGQGGAQFSFPGGFDLNSFDLVVPQLRLSSLGRTEVVLRWAAYDSESFDLGRIGLFGIGGRHSISQYMGETPPLDMAVGAMYQTFSVGENADGGDLTSTSAFSAQVQASKRMPMGFVTFEPYTALAYESLDMDVAYDDANGNPVGVSLEGENDVRFTVGVGFNFVAGHVFADYSFANTNNFSFGLALGNVGRPR